MLLNELVATPIGASLVMAANAAYREHWWAQPIATGVAGAVVGIGAWLGFLASSDNRQSAEQLGFMADARERRKAELEHQRETMAARQARYTTIAEQLSSEHEPVRIAGLYGLSALADEWQESKNNNQRDVAIKLICAYMRAKPLATGDEEARTAALSIICAHTEGAESEWPSGSIDLTGAVLPRSIPENMYMDGADLTDVQLRGHPLLGIRMKKAQLYRANFSGSTIVAANREGALMVRSQWERSQLHMCNFKEANLREANLRGATLKGVSLVNATLIGADLSGADLRGADLAGAKFHINKLEPEVAISTPSDSYPDAKVAIWDDNTLWPNGFLIRKVVLEQMNGARSGVDSTNK
ncbi:pentapeptide repeat-containing protein [Kocuria rosea]|uniref:pentapeptide repeat-containing protein n=1 Tax=Kocuria rosea TaxID=1275 RepID=UPI000DF9E55E|nr:pentapeptide repeat-containing protein [Kocuria rosea]STX02578.1 Serine/threonine-protein kinase B [Kocuria rosea]